MYISWLLRIKLLIVSLQTCKKVWANNVDPDEMNLHFLLNLFFFQSQFLQFFFRNCLTPLLNIVYSSTIYSGRVYLRKLGVKGLMTSPNHTTGHSAMRRFSLLFLQKMIHNTRTRKPVCHDMGLVAREPVIGGMRIQQAQTSLHIRPV